jgi:hypothetical protein
MRRDTFLRSMAALAATGSLSPLALAAGAHLKMMIPANPGGGWDSTGRALGKALQDPIKGVTALTRVGVDFSQQQKDQIRPMWCGLMIPQMPRM